MSIRATNFGGVLDNISPERRKELEALWQRQDEERKKAGQKKVPQVPKMGEGVPDLPPSHFGPSASS